MIKQVAGAESGRARTDAGRPAPAGRTRWRRRSTAPERSAEAPGQAAEAPGQAAEAAGRTAEGRGRGRGGAAKAPGRSWRAVLVKALALLTAFVGMVAFAVVLARLTLVSVPGAVGQVHSNVRPGDSLRHYLLHATTVDAARQVGGNILLGLPFGLLLPVLVPKARGLLGVLLRTAAVMLLVELVQGALITGRAFDIDDVILNTTGALIGYLLLGRRAGRAVHRRPAPAATPPEGAVAGPV
ncbi:VanZ family protein [Kitasatospora sp. NBC_00240]|uniref:VanZ family protein n=1 Tax=Kitasatospora sp. NBC_00240 TaxID=2903567 RepID=UPI0022568AB8|nr:VanZ family protein [Kitasatospora sp. NBC_00240]MCX5208710.1 VanZ family protein [Kitasatospora sp. NBC_00240]